jgi:hypothetical protein
LGIIRGKRATDHSAQVLSICREIQVFLTSTSGISAVRWYFKNLRHVMKKAVATPDELPWGQA